MGIGNFNVKAKKSTKHKLHKIWQKFRKTSTPLIYPLFRMENQKTKFLFDRFFFFWSKKIFTKNISEVRLIFNVDIKKVEYLLRFDERLLLKKLCDINIRVFFKFVIRI